MTRLSLYLVTLLLGTHFPGPAIPQTPPAITAPVAGPLTIDEMRLVDLVNYERRSRGMKELVVNPLLVRVAREHSREMCELNYFDHFSPTPGLRTPKDRYLAALGHRPTWAMIAENLCYCSITDVDRSHHALMNSPAHRENILNPEFEQIGIGVYESPDGKFWITQLFLTQVD